MKSVEFFYDVGSPAAYLAYTQLPEIARRAGAEIVYRPFLLGGVFKASGNRSPLDVPAKSRWMHGDLLAFARRYGVPYTRNPHFPINTLQLMRGTYAVPEQDLLRYCNAVYQAMWVEGLDMNNLTVVAEVLTQAGFDAPAIFAACSDPAVKDKLKTVTEEAVDRGVFGAPTFFVGETMYFGQDRMDFVAEALMAS